MAARETWWTWSRCWRDRSAGPGPDAIPTAVIFIKDAKARYLFANRTLVQRCGVKRLDFLLGKTSAEVFPEQLGPPIRNRTNAS